MEELLLKMDLLKCYDQGFTFFYNYYFDNLIYLIYIYNKYIAL